MAKVPSGLLPVIEIDGRRLTESAAVMAWIEAEFPDHSPLAVAENDIEFPRYQMLMRLERRLFGDWLQWLTNNWCALTTCPRPFSPQMHRFVPPAGSWRLLALGPPTGSRYPQPQAGNRKLREPFEESLATCCLDSPQP